MNQLFFKPLRQRTVAIMEDDELRPGMAAMGKSSVEVKQLARELYRVRFLLAEHILTEGVLRKARDEALNACAKAEKANEAKTRFLASVSHDLRQPVMAANLFLSLLRKRPLGPAERKLVEPLADSLKGLTGMLNGLLEVARLDGGVVKAEPREFQLDELLRRLHGEFSGLAYETGLIFNVPTALWTLRSDPLLVEMILRNLISNAIKYTNAGTVSVLTRVEGDSVVIDVADTGRGIAPEDLDRIFEDYYQVDGTNRDHSHGYGIGLATVRRISALLGTRINVRSEIGHGSTFSLALPLAG